MQQNTAVQIAEHAVELEGDVVVQIRRDPVHSKTDDLHGGLCHDDDGEEHRRERCGAGFDSCLICGVQCGDDAALQDNGQRTAAGHDKDDVFFAGKVEAEEILGAVKQQIDQQERQLKCLEDDAEDGRRAQAIQPAGRDLRAAASAGPCSRPHADDGQQLRQPEGSLQELHQAARACVDGRPDALDAAGNAQQQVQQVQHREAGEFKKDKLKVLAELTKLRQICCDPRLHYEDYKAGSAKLDTCMELVHGALDGGHRILLFSQFTGMLDIIGKRLAKEDIAFLKLTGASSKESRAKMVAQFQAGEVPVFLISLKAGGSGLNLVGADTVIHFDPWWNPAAEDQATDRAHRIGQKHKVTVIRMITRGSIEEQVVKLGARKREMFDQMITAGEAMPTQLTPEDIRALFD